MEKAFGIVLEFFLVALIIYLVVHFMGWVFRPLTFTAVAYRRVQR